MDKLEFVNNEFNSISVPYEFGMWTGEVKYPYFTGEISEEEPKTEDGFEQSMLSVTGWHRGSYLTLEEIKERIKKHFNPITGLCGKTDSGSIAVFFSGAFFVPSGNEELKKIQINLTIKEWKGAV